MKNKNTILLGLTCLFATAYISAANVTVNVRNKTNQVITLENAVKTDLTKQPQFRTIDQIRPNQSKKITFSSETNGHQIFYRFLNIPHEKSYNAYNNHFGFDASLVKDDITFK